MKGVERRRESGAGPTQRQEQGDDREVGEGEEDLERPRARAEPGGEAKRRLRDGRVDGADAGVRNRRAERGSDSGERRIGGREGVRRAPAVGHARVPCVASPVVGQLGCSEQQRRPEQCAAQEQKRGGRSG
jgi:hypothetical protein